MRNRIPDHFYPSCFGTGASSIGTVLIRPKFLTRSIRPTKIHQQFLGHFVDVFKGFIPFENKLMN
jgi:hypothetical protein